MGNAIQYALHWHRGCTFCCSDGHAAGAQDISEAMMLALGVAVTTMLITFVVVATNLTLKYKNISRVAQARKTRLRAMMDTAVDGIITINASGL